MASLKGWWSSGRSAALAGGTYLIQKTGEVVVSGATMLQRYTIDPPARALYDALLSIALKLSFAASGAIFLLGGLFMVAGFEFLDLIDRATLTQTVALHAAVAGTIVILTRSLMWIGPLSSLPSCAPYLSAFAVTAFWQLAGVPALALVLVMSVLAALTAKSHLHLSIVVTAIAFGSIGAVRAYWLPLERLPVQLLRSDPGSRDEQIGILLTSDRGILAVTRDASSANYYEFVAWSEIKRLRHRVPVYGNSPIWSGLRPQSAK